MYFWIMSNNATGAIGPASGTHEPDASLASTGLTLVGPYNDVDNPMPPDFQAAYDNPLAYLYQNNSFVSNQNYTALQLSQTQTTQKALIEAGLNATLLGGFTSKSTGHTYVTTNFGETNMHGDLTRFNLDSTLTSVNFYTVDAGWVAHTQAQLQSAFLDGGKWKDAQYAQAQNLIGQINAATTVSAVQSITWSEAGY